MGWLFFMGSARQELNMIRHALIVGAGLGGSLLAVYLARLGFQVSVYERRADPRVKGYAGGRSINLALSARGIDGLAGAGLAESVMAREAIAMNGRIIHQAKAVDGSGGVVIYQPYSSNPDDAIHSVSRGGLNLTLICAAAEQPNVKFYFDHPCVDVLPETGSAMFAGPGGTVKVEADLIVGTDGAYSAVRQKMMKSDRFEYSQSYLRHGYKELHIPAVAFGGGAFGGYAMEPHALHIWPRGGAMMIALPNTDKSFTCTLFWPLAAEGGADGHGLENLRDAAAVRKLFEREYGDAVSLMGDYVTDYLNNPNGSLVTVRCWPWQMGGNVCLLGDASHAIVPFYGQGMNAAFEDCKQLAACLDRAGGATASREGIAAALGSYQVIRKPNSDAIADMALENFVEMRDKVGRPEFLYRKKVEQTLHRLFPQECLPQYNLVSFSTVPYVEAQQRGRELEGVCAAVVGRLPKSAADAMSAAEFESRVRELGREALRSKDSVISNAKVAQPRPLIDISPAITDAIKAWPGDTPYKRTVLMDMAKGDHITLSGISCTVHLGSHADGPNHYGYPAPGVGELPLEHFIGLARVLHSHPARGGRVGIDDLVGGAEAIESVGSRAEKIVLIRTGTFGDFSTWDSDFAGLSVELIDALAKQGVITVGIDTPSVDVQDSKDMLAHRAIFRRGIVILEGLQLAAVEPGVYEIMAAPLKLIGCDGSPVRAVLRRI